MKKGYEKFVRVGILAFLLSAILFLSVRSPVVDALIPSIVSVVSYDVGSVTWVNITVNHTPPPDLGPSHYVSNVQLEVNGTVQDLAQSPQSSVTFVVQQSLGASSNKYSVRARAYCIVHGFGAYSNLVTVPEFSPLAGALFLVLAGVALVFVKKTLGLGGDSKVSWWQSLLGHKY